jgi:photosystem II stability/assembly factor-like uncharacterized protein
LAPIIVARALALLLLTPSILLAQKPNKKSPAKPAAAIAAAADPKLKGVWEPVSYPADLLLNDVFFVTPEIGWVSGGKPGDNSGGVLLHTTDAGASWSPQLGDAESAEPPFRRLHFLDERHGWVLQRTEIGKDKLLRTADAENWDQIGTIETAWGMHDYTFTTPTNGVYLDANDNVARIMHTSDGGRTWTEAYQCAAKLQIEGLTQEIACTFKSLHFPSARVGYAVGGAHGAKRTLFVGKTTDGGKTWNLSTVSDIGGDLEVYFEQEVYFTDERTGFVHLSDKKLYRTTDGGVTWKGLITTPGPELKFADALVGWSFFSGTSLSYTTDGGTRWTSREFAFPARVNAFTLPRRDRAYVVGEHGMIYRYRVLSPAEAAIPSALAAPAMPVFDSPLDDQVGELVPIVEALAQAVGSAPDSAVGPAAGDAELPDEDTEDAAGYEEPEASTDGVATPEEEEYEVADAESADEGTTSAFTTSCCAKPLGKFDLVLTAVTGIVPHFLGQYKNTNLLLAGLRMLTDLPGRVDDLNRALRSFRKASDKAAAEAALAQVTAAVQGLSQSTAIAFQKQLPPSAEEAGEVGAAGVEEDQAEGAEMVPAEDEETIPADEAEAEAEAAAAEESGEVDGAVSEAGEVVSESVQEAEQEAKREAKKEAKKAIKKKLRF